MSIFEIHIFSTKNGSTPPYHIYVCRKFIPFLKSVFFTVVKIILLKKAVGDKLIQNYQFSWDVLFEYHWAVVPFC